MSTWRSMWGQTFPGKPRFTEKNVPDLAGKVCIVTGSNTGIGKEIARILYSKNAKVYIAARSEDKSLRAIEDIKASVTKSAGELDYLQLDLSDLHKVRESAREFLSKEKELHLLFNNAGLGYPPAGMTTAQGYEIQLGTNCVGPFLFTKLLTPVLSSTAAASPPKTVRILWTSSSAPLGIGTKGFMENLKSYERQGAFYKYAASKMGNYLHASEFGSRLGSKGIVSLSFNPGNLASDFTRFHEGTLMLWVLKKTLLWPVENGAYTSVWAGVAPEAGTGKPGQFVGPWGRFFRVTPDMVAAVRDREAGGRSLAKEFWEWSEEQVKDYL